MHISTDFIELAALLTSVHWNIQSVWGTYKSWSVWRCTLQKEDQAYLRPIAMRRMTQQMFMVLWSGTAVLSSVITLFLPVGELQSSIRNYTIASFGLFGSFRAAADYLQQRSIDSQVWDGKDRRTS